MKIVRSTAGRASLERGIGCFGSTSQRLNGGRYAFGLPEADSRFCGETWSRDLTSTPMRPSSGDASVRAMLRFHACHMEFFELLRTV